MATKDIKSVLSVFQGIGNREPGSATKPMHETKYTQHYPYALDGVDGVKQWITHLPVEKSPLKTIRAFQDGPYVFTHTVGDVLGHNVFFDIFKMEQGLIIEHWVVWTAITPPNESGHTQTHGPTEANDAKDTESNKSIVRNLYEAVLIPREYQKLTEYFTGDFVRHDPVGVDGIAAFVQLLDSAAEHGVVLKIDEVKFVLGQGDFVLVAAKGSLAADHYVWFEPFRLNGGKIVEQWGVSQKIPPPEEWKNNNGILRVSSLRQYSFSI
jgi:predicted SnoaL-like aldol condensation-catalyzing enzyme